MPKPRPAGLLLQLAVGPCVLDADAERKSQWVWKWLPLAVHEEEVPRKCLSTWQRSLILLWIHSLYCCWASVGQWWVQDLGDNSGWHVLLWGETQENICLNPWPAHVLQFHPSLLQGWRWYLTGVGIGHKKGKTGQMSTGQSCICEEKGLVLKQLH